MVSYETLTPAQAQVIADKVNKALKNLGISLNQLASLAGVSQSMAYGAQHARLKRRTPNVRRLELYIHIVLGERDAADVRELDRDIAGYLSAGGDVTALRAHIRALADVQRQASVHVASATKRL